MCDANRNLLAEHGILYPSGRLHAQLGSYFADNKNAYIYNVLENRTNFEDIKRDDEAYFRSLDQEIIRSKLSTLVLSYEGFVAFNEEELNKFRDYLKGISDDINVIYYCRHPLTFAPSEMSQRIRFGYTLKNGSNSSRLVLPSIPITPHKDFIEKLALCFGKEKIILVDYEKAISATGDVRRDFLDRIGFQQTENAELRLPNEKSNASLTAEAVMLAEALIDLEKSYDHRSSFYARYDSILTKIPGKPIQLTTAQVTGVLNASTPHTDYLRNEFGIELLRPNVETANDELIDENDFVKALAQYIQRGGHGTELNVLRSELDSSKKELRNKTDETSNLSADLAEARRSLAIANARAAALKGHMTKVNEGFLWKIMISVSNVCNSFSGIIPRRRISISHGSENTQIFTIGRGIKKNILVFENAVQSKTLVIEIPRAISPNQLGLGADDRTLGIGLIKLEIISTHGPVDRRVICFDEPTLPEFIEEIVGLSTPEPWGTWSEGGVVVLNFRNPLPYSFELRLEASAFGPNVGRTFIAHLFNSYSDEFKADEMKPDSLKRLLGQSRTFSQIRSTVSSVFPLQWINSLRRVGGLKRHSSSNVEFMIDPQPEAVFAWQLLIDKSNNQSKS